jgi:hypothetical protein
VPDTTVPFFNSIVTDSLLSFMRNLNTTSADYGQKTRVFCIKEQQFNAPDELHLKILVNTNSQNGYDTCCPKGWRSLQVDRAEKSDAFMHPWADGR